MPGVESQVGVADEGLVELCLARSSFQADGKSYAPEPLERISTHFRSLQRGPRLTAATKELLKVSFFLAKKKGAKVAADQLLAVANTSTQMLKRRSDRFDGFN